jgi:hypothetical protein
MKILCVNHGWSSGRGGVVRKAVPLVLRSMHASCCWYCASLPPAAAGRRHPPSSTLPLDIGADTHTHCTTAPLSHVPNPPTSDNILLLPTGLAAVCLALPGKQLLQYACRPAAVQWWGSYSWNAPPLKTRVATPTAGTSPRQQLCTRWAVLLYMCTCVWAGTGGTGN